MIFSDELNVGREKTTNFKLPVPVIIRTTIVFFVLFATNDLAVLIFDGGLLEIRILGTTPG